MINVYDIRESHDVTNGLGSAVESHVQIRCTMLTCCVPGAMRPCQADHCGRLAAQVPLLLVGDA